MGSPILAINGVWAISPRTLIPIIRRNTLSLEERTDAFLEKARINWKKNPRRGFYNKVATTLCDETYSCVWPKRERPWNKGVPNPALSERQRGPNNPNWKGGVSVDSPKFRQSSEYKTWRKAVIERDGYKCVVCGARNIDGKRVVFHVDHIFPFSTHPEKRLDMDNGRTLCFDCHKKTDTYGYTDYFKSKKVSKN